MKKLISSGLLSSMLLNAGMSPALAVSNYSQTATANETKSAVNAQEAANTLIRNHCQYLAGNAEMNAVVKSKLSAIEKNAEKALAAYQGVKNPYVMFSGDGYDMSDAKTVNAPPVTSDPFYKNAQYLYDMALAYATSGTKYY